MKQMKTLTINGQTFEISDPKAVKASDIASNGLTASRLVVKPTEVGFNIESHGYIQPNINGGHYDQYAAVAWFGGTEDSHDRVILRNIHEGMEDYDAVTKKQLDDAIAAAGGAAAEKSYELIEDITLTESVTSITRTTDTNGNPYNFSAVRVLAEVPACEGAPSNSKLIYSMDGTNTPFMVYRGVNNGIHATAAKASSFVARNDHGFLEHYSVVASKISSAGTLESKPDDMLMPWENITKIQILVDKSAGVSLPVGIRFRIYAVRG